MPIRKTVSVLLEIKESPDFFPASAPMAYSCYKGQSAVFGLTLNPNSSFTGRASLDLGNPLVTAYSFSQPDIGPGETVTLTIDTTEMELGSGAIDIVFEEIV